MPVSTTAKLATHIWRGAAQSAANAAHTSASTLRSAFQGTASSSTTGAVGGSSSTGSASSWSSGLSGGGSSAGAGTGGAKYHAGRNAHFTYQNSGRAISQASSSTNIDGNNGRNDDEEEHRRHKAYQLRLRAQKGGSPLRGSVSLPNLTTIQMQARFRHAFAANRKQLPDAPSDGAHPGESRAYSTQAPADSAAAAASTSEAIDAALGELQASHDQQDVGALHASEGGPDKSRSRKGRASPLDAFYRQTKQAILRKDAEAIAKQVADFRVLPKSEQSLAGFNIAMEALLSVRKDGAPVTDITDIYTQLIVNGLSPNNRTFSVLVQALCARDVEVQRTFIAKAGKVDDGSAEADSAIGERSELADLRKEDNYQQALQLFNVAHNSHQWFPDELAYNAVLKSCAIRGDVDKAIGVLDLLERSSFAQSNQQTFKHLINTFMFDPQVRPEETADEAKARKLAACKQVFDEFLETRNEVTSSRAEDGSVWRTLIAACFRLGDPSSAVALFEKMTVSGSTEAGSQVPVINSSTVSAMIRGFLEIGDLPTALDWFSKVVSSTDRDGAPMPLPDCHTLEMLMTPVAERPDMIAMHNRLFDVYLKQGKWQKWNSRLDALASVVQANCRAADALLATDQAQKAASEHLDKAMDFVCEVYSRRMDYLQRFFKPSSKLDNTKVSLLALCSLSDMLIRTGRVVDAGSVMTYAVIFLDKRKWETPFLPDGLQERLTATGQSFFAIAGKPLQAKASLHLLAAAEFVAPVLRQAEMLDETFAAGLAQLYRKACNDETLAEVVRTPLSGQGWSMVLDAFCFEESNFRPLDLGAFKADGIARLLDDLAQLPVNPIHGDASGRPQLDLTAAIALTKKRYGRDALSCFTAWVPDVVEAEAQPASPATAASEVSSNTFGESDSAPASNTSIRATSPRYRHHKQLAPLQRTDLPIAAVKNADFTFPEVQVIDTDFGRLLTDLNKFSNNSTPQEIYGRVHEQLRYGNFAHPEGLAALILAFGRSRDFDKLNELYAMAQHVLHALGGDPEWQSSAWFRVEDAMISALSHAGNAEAAIVHRHRIVAAGGTPTASAYAALIATIRDTTDDAAIAQELFDESQRFGIKPTAFLFNTVISKLSRARKAERALQLFDEMTITHQIRPTSVTYGAVINACTRIGDEERAVQLFGRMESDPSFKPRVPPYNTMMQFYIQNVPNREKAKAYYDKLVQAGVAPSAHTYKLMLDMYGAIEPAQPEQMEAIFDELVRDAGVAVQGTHWASLINCYGVMLRDLDKAIATFESIATHPSSVANKNRSQLPDAVSFEALLAVFVAHGRTDLIRTHFAKMKDSGVRMTAYVANLVIRGYSMEGVEGLQEARQLFESMIEPAAGVAAPGNHPPRAPGAGAPSSPEQQQHQESARRSSNEGVATTHKGASPFAVVHREPSTYETMIRAEMAHGNRDQARKLVERMEARAFPPALLIRAASLVSEVPPSQLSEQPQPADAIDSSTFNTVPNKHSFVRSPRLGNTALPASSNSSQGIHTLHNPAQSVRHASMAAGSANAPGTSNPAPGPPKPNSPFTIFDRAAKTLQKERAAVRQTDAADESTRSAASRQTDYVRHAIAESLADRVADIKRDFPTIVELGSGAGYLRHHLDPASTGTKIIMCDTSEAMLQRDAHLDSTLPFEIERLVVDEESLPFEEGSLDCIVVSGGLHWTNDLPGVLIQIRKALKPDGVFIAGLCGGDTLFELRTSLQLAEQEREGGISPRVSPMADQRDMASLLQRAGFTIPTVDVDEVSIAYPSMFELVADLRDMGESNAVINRRPHLLRDTMLAASAIYESLHGGAKPDEVEDDVQGVPATFSLIYLIGWAPSESQPKPLKRGSAKRSLKDALAGPEGDVQKKVEEEMNKQEQERLRRSFMMSISENSGGKKNE